MIEQPGLCMAGVIASSTRTDFVGVQVEPCVTDFNAEVFDAEDQQVCHNAERWGVLLQPCFHVFHVLMHVHAGCAQASCALDRTLLAKGDAWGDRSGSGLESARIALGVVVWACTETTPGP